MRNTNETIAWYRANDTRAKLGYNPDGMCLKICREARDIPALYPSALAAQLATPKEYQVTKIADIRRGMVGFYDDPNDSNPYGHVVTFVGRVKGSDRDDLSGLLCRTNSVQSGRVTVVRGDYFPRYWGDEFQFAATWLNGRAFPDFQKTKTPAKKKKSKKPLSPAAPNLRRAIKDLEAAIEFHEKANHPRLVNALKRDIREIRQTINKFS